MDLTQIMLECSHEILKATTVAQPAIFLHSVAAAFISDSFHPAAVAGHSLGEIAAKRLIWKSWRKYGSILEF